MAVNAPRAWLITYDIADPKRLARVSDEMRSKALALRAAATLLPLAYFGFGWTQVFFAHNSGNMFYIFGLAVLWGGICRLETQPPAASQL